MPTIGNKYLENKRTKLIHIKSGSSITTDAPLDNNGKGEHFSPTDTVSGALSACMMTIMGINAEKEKIDLTGLHSVVTKFMVSNPRKISKIKIEFYWDECSATKKQRSMLKRTALVCPVARSLHPEIKQEISFDF